MKKQFFPSAILLVGACLFLNNITNAQQTIRIGGMDEAPAVKKGVGVGTMAPNIRFKDLMNTTQTSISLKELTGKLIVLEFWATWCAPCIPAMDHLDNLKKKYAGKMEVITISDESMERIQRYIKNKPSTMLFVSDVNHTTMEFFPYQSVPHTVVIAPDGKVIGITTPTELTEAAIEKILAGQNVTFKEKAPVTSGFDYTKDYFPKAADFNDYYFELQPPVPGGFPIRQTKRQKSGAPILPQFTMLNSPFNHILQAAYKLSPARMTYEGVNESDFDYRTTSQLYCVNVAVPREKESELYTYFQKRLKETDFEYGYRLEKRKVPCIIITAADPAKLATFKTKGDKAEVPGGGPKIAYSNKFEKNNVPISDFTSHMEASGFFRMPVIDATNSKDNYDFAIEIDRENPSSIKNELAKMGLKAEKSEAEVEVMVIYKK